MAKVVLTFKLEEGIYSKLREIAEREGRGVSEILKESLTDWLQAAQPISWKSWMGFGQLPEGRE